ncbi:MAG: glycosyltransferase family 4 protein [Pseudomonadota bacterium]
MTGRRIVHAITRLITGGAEENTILTCNHQARSGNPTYLIIGRSYDEATLATVDPAVNVIVVPSLVRNISPFNDFAALIRLVSLFRRLKPDVVHTHTSKAGIVGRIAALFVRGCAVVHTVHILPFLNVGRVELLVYLFVERLTARWTKLFIHVSEGMHRSCLEHGVGTKSNHVVIESGMDVARFRSVERPASWQAVIHGGVTIDDDEPLFILISGALERRKRAKEFLPVFKAVKEAVPEAHLLIAGDGPLGEEIDQTITELGLEASCHRLGFIDNLPEVIALTDVCVHAAHREGLPRVVVQYVMIGRPVVAAHLPGLERVVREGETGFMVPTESLDSMTDPLITLLRDPDLRKRLGDAGRAQDFSPWDAERMVVAIDGAYDRYLGP